MTLKTRLLRARNIHGKIIDKKAALGFSSDTITDRAKYMRIGLCERQIGRHIEMRPKERAQFGKQIIDCLREKAVIIGQKRQAMALSE
jgi:hypothetical protein